MHIALLFLLVSLSSWSTTFALQPIEQQIKEANGIVIGHYLSSKSVSLESGAVATQMIFKVQKEWGMQSDLFGLEEVIVHYPGGKKNGQHIQVQGVPRFVVGEKVALFTKNIGNRYWGHNLGFGTFKIVNYGNETMMVNTLFPEDPRVGQVKLNVFESKVKQIKGTGFKVVRQDSPRTSVDRVPSSISEGKKRSIASKVDREDNKDDQSGPEVYWLIAVLAFAGGMSRFIRSKDA